MSQDESSIYRNRFYCAIEESGHSLTTLAKIDFLLLQIKLENPSKQLCYQDKVSYRAGFQKVDVGLIYSIQILSNEPVTQIWHFVSVMNYHKLIVSWNRRTVIIALHVIKRFWLYQMAGLMELDNSISATAILVVRNLELYRFLVFWNVHCPSALYIKSGPSSHQFHDSSEIKGNVKCKSP